MRLLNRGEQPSIFVGDGLSDKYAASEAGLLFAKNSLAAYCRQQAMEFVPFEELDEVAAWLVDALPFGSSVFSNRREALSA
jgi:2-hydroxy-3-keto-5-methylthiopentenyl-1-phosphate phosphatase